MNVLDQMKAAQQELVAGRTRRIHLPRMGGLPQMSLGVRSINRERFAALTDDGGYVDDPRKAARLVAAFAEHGDGITVDGVTFARWCLDTCPPEQHTDVAALITWNPDDEPTTLSRLAHILDLGFQSAADVVLWLAPPDNDIGPIALANDINFWLTDGTLIAARMVSGE